MEMSAGHSYRWPLVRGRWGAGILPLRALTHFRGQPRCWERIGIGEQITVDDFPVRIVLHRNLVDAITGLAEPAVEHALRIFAALSAVTINAIRPGMSAVIRPFEGHERSAADNALRQKNEICDSTA